MTALAFIILVVIPVVWISLEIKNAPRACESDEYGFRLCENCNRCTGHYK